MTQVVVVRPANRVVKVGHQVQVVRVAAGVKVVKVGMQGPPGSVPGNVLTADGDNILEAGGRLRGLPDPTEDNEAATKQYVDENGGGGGGGAVDSVNGQTGVVVLDSDDVAEGAANRYYTDERVDDRVSALLVEGENVTLTYNDAEGTITIDAASGGGGAVDSVNGQTGDVVLDTGDIADTTDARYVSDADLVVLGNTSGTNTGDQNLFATIAVAGQSDIVADGPADTLTLAAGAGIAITTDPSTDTATIASTITEHDAVTVTDSAEIDFTLTGQNITASIKAGSLDETKLDASVNASLDLADSATQPGDNVSTLTNDAGYIAGITAESLGDLSDVTQTDLGADELLFTQDGVTWVNQTLAEAGIAAVGHTHAASDITDFDTEVSNNADVAANTAARHAAVTVTDSAEIDFTLTGQNITATLVTGSIDETKLDASVNASLNLADSAVQPGDNISSLTNDAGYITATLSQEQVEDYAGALVATGGTKTRITVTYQDATNDMDFVVDDDLGNYDSSNLSITASQVSDFDTEVSNNADVAANTAARHAAVTVVDSDEIDFTLTGQQITASLKAGSIDETKLDASVNASLDLADSASQPGHAHAASDITDFDTEVANNADVAANTAARHDAVTLAGSPDYLTLSGQQITLGAIDLTTDVTGILPAANGGTGNGFTQFSGPASSAKTFNLPNANDTIATLGQANNFTGQNRFGDASNYSQFSTAGDLTQAGTAKTLVATNWWAFAPAAVPAAGMKFTNELQPTGYHLLQTGTGNPSAVGFASGGGNAVHITARAFGYLETVVAQLTADQNNYTGYNGIPLAIVSSDATRTVTGISSSGSGTPSTLAWVYNNGAENIVYANESASSTDVNRMLTPDGSDLTLAPGKMMVRQYIKEIGRWRVWLAY